MNEEKNLLTARAADALLACADGTAALLYLHILRTGGFSLSAAARDLKRSEADVALAAQTLRRLGLLAVQPRQTEGELPQYTAEDVVSLLERDNAFSGVVAEAERILGRVLNSNDLKLLSGLYDHLGLPADVLMLLLHHCVETWQEAHGPGRMPTMRAIEKEGWYWAGQEILSLDAAEEHMRRERARRDAVEQVKDALQLRGQALSKSQRECVDKWLSMGFGPEAVAIAYDRTMFRTNKLSWNYMDKILCSWDGAGLHSPEEIEAGDPGRKPKPAAAPAAPVDNDKKLKDMRKMYESIRRSSGGEEGKK